MSLNQSLILEFSGIVGNQNIALGAEDGFNTWSTKSSADIGLTKPDNSALCIAPVNTKSWFHSNIKCNFLMYKVEMHSFISVRQKDYFCNLGIDHLHS